MGKRKSRSKTPAPKKRKENKLDSVFNCPFCNHEKSVDCTIDRNNMVGAVLCRICHESFNTSVNNLTEAVDVYSEWIDECERANEVDGHLSS